MRARQHHVVPEQQRDQEDAADDQAARHGGEAQMQRDQVPLVLGDPFGAVSVAGGRKLYHLPVERREEPQQLRGVAGPGDIVDQRFRRPDHLLQRIDDCAFGRIGFEELRDVALAEQLGAVDQDIVTQLHFVVGDIVSAVGTDPLLEARMLGRGLAQQEGHVVARHLFEHFLALEHECRDIDRGRHEQDDDGRKHQLDLADRRHTRTRRPCVTSQQVQRPTTGRPTGGRKTT